MYLPRCVVGVEMFRAYSYLIFSSFLGSGKTKVLLGGSNVTNFGQQTVSGCDKCHFWTEEVKNRCATLQIFFPPESQAQRCEHEESEVPISLGP